MATEAQAKKLYADALKKHDSVEHSWEAFNISGKTKEDKYEEAGNLFSNAARMYKDLALYRSGGECISKIRWLFPENKVLRRKLLQEYHRSRTLLIQK